MSNMVPVTQGYARLSKTGDSTRNLKTQIHILQEFEIRGAHIFDAADAWQPHVSPLWNELVGRVRPNDTVVVAWLDRFSRNFDEGVRNQADLTKQSIGVVAIREGIHTAAASAAAKLVRRMMLAQ